MTPQEQLQFEMSVVFDEIRDLEVHLAAAQEDVDRVRHGVEAVSEHVTQCEGAMKTVLSGDVVSMEDYKDARAILNVARAHLEGARIAVAKRDSDAKKHRAALEKARAHYNELHEKLRNLPVATVTRLFPKVDA